MQRLPALNAAQIQCSRLLQSTVPPVAAVQSCDDVCPQIAVSDCTAALEQKPRYTYALANARRSQSRAWPLRGTSKGHRNRHHEQRLAAQCSSSQLRHIAAGRSPTFLHYPASLSCDDVLAGGHQRFLPQCSSWIHVMRLRLEGVAMPIACLAITR